MIPLSERPGFGNLASLDDAGGDEVDGEKFREKFNARLTLVAESGDAGIALAASHVGSRLNFQAERLAILGRITRRVFATAPESIFSEEIQRFREKVERDVAESVERERRREMSEGAERDRKIMVEAETMNVGDLLREIEGRGARLALDGEQIVVRGGSLTDRQRVIMKLPRMRRQLFDALRGREHMETV
jgi:hypothetical protein